MRYLLFLLGLLAAVIFLSSCGPKPKDGINGAIGAQGNDGSRGATGDTGNSGSNGYNSLVAFAPSAACATGGYTILAGLDSNRNGVLDGAEVSSSADICNGATGAAGANGQDATTAFTPVVALDPCGTAAGVNNEIMLRLENGSVLASFTDGGGTRFSLLTAGNYVTTDGDNCYFTLTNQGFITNEHH